MSMQGLTADKIQDLMQNSRTRNAYGPKLVEFVESDEAAINPAETWPMDFGKKNASTLYQGFITAAKKGNLSDVILVKKVEDSVFLLHKERVAIVMDASQNGNSNGS